MKEGAPFDSPLAGQLSAAFDDLGEATIEPPPSKEADAVRAGATAAGVAKRILKDLASGRITPGSSGDRPKYV